MTLPIGGVSAYLELVGGQQFEQGVVGAQRSLNLTGEAAQRAAGGFESVDAALQRTGASASRAASSTAKVRAAQLSALSAAERFTELLNSQDASTARLASSEATLIRANERVAASMRSSSVATAAQSTAFGEARGKAAGFMATTAKLGLGLAAFEVFVKGIDLVKAGAQFQQSMLLIKTNANASTTEVNNMTAAVLKLAPELATSPMDLANALYHVEQNGLRGAKALEALKVGAQGAKIGMADVEDTTNTMTIAVASGINGMQDLQKAMGAMIAIAGTGDMHLKDLNEALSGGILSVAKGFGASLQDVAAILATLGDNGIRGADAATAVRQSLMGFAQPAKGGADALAQVGLQMHSLRDEMEKHGLVAAMNDLEKHMTKAGVTGSKVGGFITQAFGKKAGAGLSVLMGEIDRVNGKFSEAAKGAAGFQSKWDATTHTVAFSFQRLGAIAQTAGIEVFEKGGPIAAQFADILGKLLPTAFHTAQQAMVPFVDVWHVLEPLLADAADALGHVAHVLGPLAPIAQGGAAAVAAMWVAFKGYQLAVLGVYRVQDATAKMGASVSNSFGSMRQSMSSTASESALTAQVMQAEFAKIEAAALQEAATIARATATELESQAQLVAAWDDATARMIVDAEARARAATASADEAEVAAATSATAAETASASIAESGAAARVGWAGVAGPLGLAIVGVTTLVSMFHKSDTASRAAAVAAKAYTDALKDGGTGAANVLDTIEKQLANTFNPDKLNILDQIDEVNLSLRLAKFGQAQISAQGFAKAIADGGTELATLRARLESIDKHFKGNENPMLSGIAHDARELLKELNDQAAAYEEAVRKDLETTKAFAGVSSSIDTVSTSLGVNADAARQYAQMSGIVVDKNGVAAKSSADLTAAVKRVSDAYGTASATGMDYLDAVKTFSASSGTAADRAAIIGATLKASNGDALGFAATMTGSAQAVDALTGAFAQQQDQLAQQDKKQSAAAARVAAAQARLDAVRGRSKHTAAQLASAEAGLASAQAAAGKAGALSYADTERAALRFKKTQDGLVATINTSAKGAGDLVGQLQSIQSAAVTAAGAMYQHDRATKSAKDSADDAYKLYVTKTQGALIDNAAKLHLTDKQARALAKSYLDTPKSVKTLIEQEGANPVVTVLDRIGRLLANLTGQQWDIKAKATIDTSQLRNQLKKYPFLGAGVNANGQTEISGGGRYASGGPITGSGAKGVDSVPIVAAPGEWVMNDRAVDHYGPAFMRAVNSMTLKMPTASAPAGVANGPAVSQPLVAGTRQYIHVDKIEQNVSNPVPEPLSLTGPANLRRAALALGR